eukprot:4617275-Amphidinium_carterae.1
MMHWSCGVVLQEGLDAVTGALNEPFMNNFIGLGASKLYQHLRTDTSILLFHNCKRLQRLCVPMFLAAEP